MVVHDLDIFRSGFRPAKANSPLVVNANAVLTGAIAFQGLKAVAGRYSQVSETSGDLELPHLASRDGSETREATDADTCGEGFGVRTLEGSDHSPIVTRSVINVKRE